jgi:hypothetical protein
VTAVQCIAQFTAAFEFVFSVDHISERVLCKTADAPNVEFKIGRSSESENGLQNKAKTPDLKSEAAVKLVKCCKTVVLTATVRCK